MEQVNKYTKYTECLHHAKYRQISEITILTPCTARKQITETIIRTPCKNLLFEHHVQHIDSSVNLLFEHHVQHPFGTVSF
jgi:hypothetical protein